MKAILRVIQSILVVYIFIVIFLDLAVLAQKKILNENYPTLFGFSYLKMEEDNTDQSLKNDELILLKNTSDVKIGDFIVYKDSTNSSLLNGTISNFINENDPINTNELNDETTIIINNSELTTTKEYVLGKMIYHNEKLSNVISILVNPITLVIAIIIAVIISNHSYERYK